MESGYRIMWTLASGTTYARCRRPCKLLLTPFLKNPMLYFLGNTKEEIPYPKRTWEETALPLLNSIPTKYYRYSQNKTSSSPLRIKEIQKKTRKAYYGMNFVISTTTLYLEARPITPGCRPSFGAAGLAVMHRNLLLL